MISIKMLNKSVQNSPASSDTVHTIPHVILLSLLIENSFPGVFFILGNLGMDPAIPGYPGMTHSINIGPVIVPGIGLRPATANHEVRTTSTVCCRQTVHVLHHYCVRSCDYCNQDEVTNKITVYKLTIINEFVSKLTITNRDGVCVNASCSVLDNVTKTVMSDYSEETTAFCPLHLVVRTSEVT